MKCCVDIPHRQRGVVSCFGERIFIEPITIMIGQMNVFGSLSNPPLSQKFIHIQFDQ